MQSLELIRWCLEMEVVETEKERQRNSSSSKAIADTCIHEILESNDDRNREAGGRQYSAVINKYWSVVGPLVNSLALLVNCATISDPGRVIRNRVLAVGPQGPPTLVRELPPQRRPNFSDKGGGGIGRP